MNIHNIGIIAHIDAGKTTTTERMLFFAGKTHKIGEVDTGTAQMDWMEQEQNRGITISSACTTIDWHEHSINIIDTPGHVDFTIEVERSLRVLDGAVGIFCAVSGVEPQSETVWHQAEHYHVARIAYINKIDRLGADFYAVLKDIQAKLSSEALPLYIPIGSEKDFEGIIDLLKMKEILWDKNSDGVIYSTQDIRDSYKEQAETWHNHLREKIIEYSDVLTEKFLNEEAISNQELTQTLRKAVQEHALLPVLCGSSLQNIGVQPLLDAVVQYLPYPQETPPPLLHAMSPSGNATKPLQEYKNALLGFVFKSVVDKDYGLMHYVRIYKGTLKKGSTVINTNTQKKERVLRILKMHANKSTQCEELHAGEIAVLIGPKSFITGHSFSDSTHDAYMLEGIQNIAPVISTTLEVQTLSDREQLLEVLQKLEIEDPSFHHKEDENTGQILISGMGELHLEVLATKIQNDYKLPVRQGHPTVNYKEAVTSQYSEVYTLDHIPGQTDLSIKASIELQVGAAEQEGNIISNAVPNSVADIWLRYVENSIEDSMKSGVAFGYPMVNTHVHILDISYEGNESIAEMSLRYSAAQAFYTIAHKATVVCMEPIMKVIITVPTDFVGDAMQPLNVRNSIIHNVDTKGNISIIHAESALSTLFGFSTVLRNSTEGRGRYSMEFLRYAQKEK